MKRSDLPELQYIVPISNVPSILANGILSNRAAAQFPHASVASPVIQSRRVPKAIPGGGPLHDYANLYLCARNPMLYRLKDGHLNLSVLQISTDVLDLPGVIIADGNAASDYTAFRASPDGLEKVDGELVFAEYWTDDNQIIEWQKKSVKCAEVLVPDRVPPRFILGAYVCCNASLQIFRATGCNLNCVIDGHLFFR